MLQDFQQLALRPIQAGQVVGALLVALACGFVISLIYRWTYRGSSYAPSFVRSMIFLAMITAVVMLVIGNNLARAFGLVGAMSIIRFRTAVKDTQDIVFIFFSLAVGLAAGVGMYMVAIIGTLMIGGTIFVTARTEYAAINKRAYLLQLSYDGPGGDGAPASYVPVLQRYCRSHKLINVKSAGAGDRLDLTFYVALRRRDQSALLTHDLATTPNISNVNLYFDEEQM